LILRTDKTQFKLQSNIRISRIEGSGVKGNYKECSLGNIAICPFLLMRNNNNEGSVRIFGESFVYLQMNQTRI